MPETANTEKKKEIVLIEGLFESQAQKDASTRFVGYNAFGSRVCAHSGTARRVACPFIVTYGIKPVEGDASRTVGVVTKKELVAEVIDSYKDSVGMRAILKQVALGLVSQKSLSCIDEEGVTVDDTLVPSYVGDMSKIAETNMAKSLESAKKLGVDPSKIDGSNFEQIIKDTVAATIEAMTKKEEK